MIAQFCEYTEKNELYSLNVWILYISIIAQQNHEEL